MTNPFQHGSSNVPQDIAFTGFLPRLRSSYASVVSGSNPPASSSVHPPLNPISQLLNPAHDLSSNLYGPPSSAFRDSAMSSERIGASPDAMGSGQRPPQLPSFSRAFEMFMTGASPDNMWSSPQRFNGFFIPTYLQGTDYMLRLEEAHRVQLAQKELHQQSTGGLQDGLSGSPPSGKTPASHLGMTYDLIERAPSFDDDESISPLPSRWNKDDKYGGLQVFAEGQEVRYTAPRTSGEREYEASAIRADHPMPQQAGIYYFEVTILSRKRDETTICIGFLSKSAILSRPPGWEPDTWGFHGDDGNAYAGHNVGKHYGPPFGSNDTIGCGVNFRTGSVFFTKNGVNLGIAFRDVKGKLYPSVGLKKSGEHVRVNFGQAPFVYDIDGMMKQEQAKIQKAISETSPEKLVSPPLSETDLIQQLVLQFLQHDGYVETARAFAEEIREEKQALNLDPNVEIEDINIKDDEDANHRQRIRRAILEGDIDKALKYTNAFYPRVLADNEHVYFKLRCRKFIEMIRKASEMDGGNGKSRSNGHSFDDIRNQMDLDENGENGFGDKMETEDGSEFLPDQEGLLAAIEYGQQLQAEFKNDPRNEVDRTLKEVFSLIAYSNPLQNKELAHLLDRKGRAAVAEELNSVILQSLGKSSRSALENLYGQTSVLLDYLREDGGSGAFTTIQSVVDDIPKAHIF